LAIKHQYNCYAGTLYAEMKNNVLLKIEMAMVSHNGNIRHCAQSAFRPAMVGIRPLLGSCHWSAFRRSAFGHALKKSTLLTYLLSYLHAHI